MFWNVASARYEISLRKWSGGTVQLRTSEAALIAKNGALLAAMLLFHSSSLYIV